MPEAYLAKTANGYIPADDESIDRMRSIQFGAVIKVKYSIPRDYEKHKRFFAFLNTTFDMQEHFETVAHYRAWLTMKAGYYETVTAPNGSVVFLPKSIAFGKMEQHDFDALFKTCIDVFLRELGKGISEDEILRAIEFA